jgi:hypothetical protein
MSFYFTTSSDLISWSSARLIAQLPPNGYERSRFCVFS